MSDQAMADEWPDSAHWWLTVYSESDKHPGFDSIEISVQSDDFKRVITSVMVPKIFGMVRESHNFISYLIHKNTEALRKRCAELEEDLEIAKSLLTVEMRGSAGFSLKLAVAVGGLKDIERSPFSADSSDLIAHAKSTLVEIEEMK